MTAFDHFQLATCFLVRDGDPHVAIQHLDAAIRQIDLDGVDAALRLDLVELRATAARRL